MALDTLAQVTVRSRAELRDWLAAHHTQRESIWLLSYKKHTPFYVPYPEIVEEALCWGWIDGRTRRFDEDRMGLLFSPRKPRSVWSKVNKERVAKLLSQGLIAPAGLAKIEAAKRDGSWTSQDAIENLEYPADLLAALAANAQANSHFHSFNRSAKKILLQWILTAKRPETRAQRIATTVAEAAQGRRANLPAPREA